MGIQPKLRPYRLHIDAASSNSSKTRNRPDAELRSFREDGTVVVQKREQRTAPEWHDKIRRTRSSRERLTEVSLKEK